MKSPLTHLWIAILFISCNGQGSERSNTNNGAPNDSLPVLLEQGDVSISWTVLSSEGTIAARGSCSSVALSYDRSQTSMTGSIGSLAFEVLGTDCSTGDHHKDQFLYSYLLNSTKDNAIIAGNVVQYSGGDQVEVTIGIGGTTWSGTGDIRFNDMEATVHLELPMSAIGLSTAMTQLVTAWSKRTGSGEGLSELVELEISARFRPIEATL